LLGFSSICSGSSSVQFNLLRFKFSSFYLFRRFKFTSVCSGSNSVQSAQVPVQLSSCHVFSRFKFSSVLFAQVQFAQVQVQFHLLMLLFSSVHFMFFPGSGSIQFNLCLELGSGSVFSSSLPKNALCYLCSPRRALAKIIFISGSVSSLKVPKSVPYRNSGAVSLFQVLRFKFRNFTLSVLVCW
jgi:hypothetical protein